MERKTLGSIDGEEQTVQVLSRVDCITHHTWTDDFVYSVFAKGDGCTVLLRAEYSFSELRGRVCVCLAT